MCCAATTRSILRRSQKDTREMVDRYSTEHPTAILDFLISKSSQRRMSSHILNKFAIRRRSLISNSRNQVPRKGTHTLSITYYRHIRGGSADQWKRGHSVEAPDFRLQNLCGAQHVRTIAPRFHPLSRADTSVWERVAEAQ